jgi:RNA polymerase sigma-32 factor
MAPGQLSHLESTSSCSKRLELQMPVKSVAVADKTLDVPDRAGGYAKSYASTIMRYDLLERGQEQELARRWHERRDRVATDALVTSHLRLAARVARRYRGYGLPLSDLIAEANLGLVIAASRFEAGRGSRFSTYALWWIKAAIHDYILRSWSLVKIGTTSAQRKLFFGLRREMRKFAGTTSGLTPETVEAVARELEVSPRDVIEMDRRLTGDLSLNTPITDDGQTTEWEAMLVDESPDAETIVGDHDERALRSEALHAALGVLSERERRVLEARRLAEDPPSLEALGREMSISNERVRQIEARAFEKVKRAAGEHLTRKAAARLTTTARLGPACQA